MANTNDSDVASDDFIEAARSIARFCEANELPAGANLQPAVCAFLSCALFLWPIDRTTWAMPRDMWRGRAWHQYFFRCEVNSYNPHLQASARKLKLMSFDQLSRQKRVELECPIFLERENANRFLSSLSPAATAPKYRNPGDAQLVEEGIMAVRGGKVTSALAAAKVLAPRAKGQSLESKTERLRKLIKAGLNK
jgi:hypothetical protein